MRKAVRLAVVAVLAFVVVAMPSVARADGRVALVVGNSVASTAARSEALNGPAWPRSRSAAVRR